MTLSLRGRLLIGVIGLMVLGLLAANVAIYVSLQNFLIGQLDNQLRGGVNETADALGYGPPVQHPSFPVGTVVELLNPDGTVARAKVAGYATSSNAVATPVLPRAFTTTSFDAPVAPFTVGGSDGETQFRMTYWSEGRFEGQTAVLAIPLTDVQSTLRGLLLNEVLISSVVVVGTALMAFVIIQVGLRPLRRMGAAAGLIAAGDLSRRVEPSTPKTEIGRLGLALNAMLSQIEAAFAQSKASEQRLRRFIADASHELRTPLTSIRGYSEMLRRGAAESPSDSETARRRIEEESVRMSTLVDDMLLIARLDQGRPLETKPVNLQAIARDAVDDARAVAPKRDITLSADQAIVVAGDDTRLRQVISNLMRNALVHTPQSTPIEVAVTTEDSVARMSVTDHGPGLSLDQMPRIFEPFYRADPSRSRDSGGAGLGLSIVNAVVAAHGGRVWVKETSGGGATFEVELPLASKST